MELLRNYPNWLCRRGVTFGFLRAVPGAYGHNRRPCVKICDSLFGMELISFGIQEKARRVAVSDGDGDDDDSTKKKRVVLAAREFPVVGGLLSMPVHDCGCIHFTVAKHKCGQGMQYELESRVMDYCPAIAGSAPVGWVRRCAYLGTQTLVHVYVMRRYHGYVHEAISKGALS